MSPAGSTGPAPEMICTRFSARPSASATRLAVTPAPEPLIEVSRESSVVVPSTVMDWPLIRKLPSFTV